MQVCRFIYFLSWHQLHRFVPCVGSRVRATAARRAAVFRSPRSTPVLYGLRPTKRRFCAIPLRIRSAPGTSQNRRCCAIRAIFCPPCAPSAPGAPRRRRTAPQTACTSLPLVAVCAPSLTPAGVPHPLRPCASRAQSNASRCTACAFYIKQPETPILWAISEKRASASILF